MNLSEYTIPLPCGEVSEARLVPTLSVTLTWSAGEKTMTKGNPGVRGRTFTSQVEPCAPRSVVFLIVTDGVASEQSILAIKTKTDLTNGTN